MPAPAESYDLAVRAYAVSVKRPVERRSEPTERKLPLGPSAWSLTFDTETCTDAAQQLRVGAYQLHENNRLDDAGYLYDPCSLSDAERSRLYHYATVHGLMVRTVEEFIEEIFFPYLYDLRGTGIGFNLPFDLSRIARAHAPARGHGMRGGFTFRLSADSRRPRIQVKSLNSRAALIRFTVPEGQRTPRGMRRRRLTVPAHRGSFVDVRTLAGALLSGSWSLRRLADHLQTPSRKLAVEDYGAPIDDGLLEYAIADVQTTWDCYSVLAEQFAGYGLTGTLVSSIYSEASLGKACLREMGVRPWRDQQPDVPPELVGHIVSTYYGGRAEVRIRRKAVRVLYCDFLSMYPTVCTLMGLWRFVIAERLAWEDASDDARSILARVGADDLQRPATWHDLTLLVEVQPDVDIFPVRTKYDGAQYAIGLNELSSDTPLWYTLADCIASKLLTGKMPRVLRAVRFTPVGCQEGLKPLAVMGKPEYRVDPTEQDFYRRLIDLRAAVRVQLTDAKTRGDRALGDHLQAEQQVIKIVASATSYGIFVELNLEEYADAQEVTCYGPTGDGFRTNVCQVEEPGRYFHPLLATLITGAARLMLALVEVRAADEGLGWAFCDTDSMALARPEGMDDTEFLQRAGRVREWFNALNPYETPQEVFKVEEANYALRDGKPTEEPAELFCFAVSAKRYALFTIDAEGRPVLRKASAHGLGHLRPPYDADHAPHDIPAPAVGLKDLGVERWQYDLWYRIIEAALGPRAEQVDLTRLPGFDAPAVSRYAATTPALLRWFDDYNVGKPYREQVRPFGFLTAFQANPLASVPPETSKPLGEGGAKRLRKRDGNRYTLPHPIAPYDADPERAAAACFDRLTGEPVPRASLRSYRQVLAQYHLHPEAKFRQGDYTDRGETTRRHVALSGLQHIGKEANRWEEQVYLGADPEAQVEYGTSPEHQEQALRELREAIRRHGVRRTARESGVSLREVLELGQGKRAPRRETILKLARTNSPHGCT